MAMNFQTAAFLAGLKMPTSQIMYCISQDNGVPSPVVVYKDAQQATWMTNGNQSNLYSGPMNQKNVENSSQIPTNHVPSQNVIYNATQQSYCHTQTLHSQNFTPSNPVYPFQSHQTHVQEKIESHKNSPDKHFECAACKKTFRLKSTLMQHERIHLDARPFVCNFNNTCHKSFRQKSHLIQHSRIHFDSKPYSCNYEGCGKSFRQKAILSQHERIHCDASSKLLYKNIGENATLWPFDVPYPNENGIKDEKFSHSVFGNFTNPKDESKSQKIKKDNDDEEGMTPSFIRCPICKISYKQKSTLLQHGCVHIESRPYPCLYVKCGKRFRQQSHLAQHIRIHKNEKPYACPFPECQGRCFRQRTILNQHIRIHTNSKPYRCDICSKDFRQQAILSQHEKTHQTNRPFECPLTNCKRRFVNENVSSIINHLMMRI